MNSESELEQTVYNSFYEKLKNENFTFKLQDKWETSILIRRFDIVIYNQENVLAVIEVKTSFTNKNILARGSDQVRSALVITNARFGILTDGVSYYFYDRNYKDKDFEPLLLDEIIIQLKNPEKINITAADRDNVSSIIKEAASAHLSENIEFQTFINTEEFQEHIKFDSEANTYFFSGEENEISSFENQFFIKMLGDFKETELCRYTSLSTIFDMLTYYSFRMNGLVGMNDKSEVNYVENYINGLEKPLIKESDAIKIAINKKYITSCSNILRKDDLTLWRLYAEDGKGVCLVFEIVNENLTSQILLQKVKYADKNGNHKELDFLKQIKENIEFVTGFKFEFKNIGHWKHFFKPYDYWVEEEIRLLVIDNGTLPKIKSSWVITFSHAIINPIVDFTLNSKVFPIRLKKIVLGPKCPEQETNFVQLNEMVRRKKEALTKNPNDTDLTKLEIELSQIKHYR